MALQPVEARFPKEGRKFFVEVKICVSASRRARASLSIAPGLSPCRSSRFGHQLA